MDEEVQLAPVMAEDVALPSAGDAINATAVTDVKLSERKALELAKKLNLGELSIEAMYNNMCNTGMEFGTDFSQNVAITMFIESKQDVLFRSINDVTQMLAQDSTREGVLAAGGDDQAKTEKFSLQATKCFDNLKQETADVAAKLGKDQWHLWIQDSPDTAEEAIDVSIDDIVREFTDKSTTSLKKLRIQLSSFSKGEGDQAADFLSRWKGALKRVEEEAVNFVEDVGAEVKRVALQLARNSEEAKAAFGMSSSIEDTYADLEELEDDNVLNFLINVAKGVLMPFAVLTAQQLVHRLAKNPIAYNAERGAELVESIRDWRILTFLPRMLHSRAKRATFFVLIYFLLGLWFMALFFLFTTDNYAKEGGDLFAWQPSIWTRDEDKKMLNNLMLFFAFLAIPFFCVVVLKLLVDAAGFEICGALVAKVEEHCWSKEGQEKAKVSVQKVGDEDDEEKNKGLVERTLKKMKQLSYANARLAVVLTVLGVIFIPAYSIYKDIRHWAGPEYAYFIFYAIGLSLVGAVAIMSLFAWVAAPLWSYALANIVAYKELLDVLCINATLQHQAEIAQVSLDLKNVTSMAVESAATRVRLHPVMAILREKLFARERFIVAASRAIKTDIGPAVDACYGCTAIFYLFMLAYIVLDFIDININGGGFDRMSFSLAFLFGIALSILALIQPLLAMAYQASAWDKVVKTCQSAAHMQVSEVLSPTKDGAWLHDHHEKLTSIFTWSVLGFPMTYSSVYGAIASYAGSIWTLTVVPAVLLGINDDLSEE